jgi:hypothetical protein
MFFLYWQKLSKPPLWTHKMGINGSSVFSSVWMCAVVLVDYELFDL